MCHLRLAKTHGHHWLEHFQFLLEVVVEVTFSKVDLPVMDATVMAVTEVTAVVTIPIMDIPVITITEVTAEVSIKAHFLTNEYVFWVDVADKICFCRN